MDQNPPVFIEGRGIREEQARRDLAFFRPRACALGVQLRPLSVRSWVTLETAGAGGMLANPDAATLRQVVDYLFIHGPDWTSVLAERPRVTFSWRWPFVTFDPRARRARLLRRALRCTTAEIATVIATIREEVSFAFNDSPAGDGAGAIPQSSVAADVVHALASAYGWTEDAILDLPLERFWQYWRAIQRERLGPKADALLVSRAQRAAVAEALDRIEAELRKAG